MTTNQVPDPINKPKPGQLSKFSSPEFRAAFNLSIPVLLGYLAIGLAFGLMIQNAGYPWWLAALMSALIYAGAGQYLAVGLFSRGASLGDMALLTFLVNARHMVYGLSLLDHIKGMGARRWYLIFALTDETYALLTSLPQCPDLNKAKLSLWISALDQVYWFLGTILGVLAGTFLPIPTDDIGFALTALFLVLVVDQWRQRPNKIPFILGALAALGGLLIAGPQMLLPAIGLALASLVLSDLVQNRPGKSLPPSESKP